MTSTDGVPLAEPFTEDRVCPGCGKSVVYDGGMVVAFGQSFFHVDCFKCAKCNNKVTADTNLLLLSDGSPVCANCSYSCNVCGLPILDEAIMTGNESYHAHCFNCKVCKKRIEELVFAKTTQGIYCMDCHNARVARSRKHQERREREKREREKRAAEAAATMPEIPRGSDGPVRSTTNGSQQLPLETQPLQLSASRSNSHPATPRSNQFPLSTSPPSISRGPSTSSTLDERMINPYSPINTQPHLTLPVSNGTPSANGSALNGGRNSSLYGRSEASVPEPSRTDSLGIPSDGMSKTMSKRKSFDDRPLNILLKDAPPSLDVTPPRQDSLLIPDAGLSRKDKRRSINPGVVASFNTLTQKPQNTSPASSPTTATQPHANKPQSPQGRDFSRVSSPLRDQFPSEITASPPSLPENTNKNQQISNPPYLSLDTSNTTDKQPAGRSRSASSSAYPEQSLPQATGSIDRQRSRSPIHPTFTLDRVPARTSSRADQRQETAPPNFNGPSENGRNTPQSADGRGSPALNGANVHKQRSFDDRSRFSSSSLSQLIELPASKGGSRPTSPAHQVDVPSNVESETEAESEGEFVALKDREDLPPLPPPKEGKGPKAGTRPPQLTLDTTHVDDRDSGEPSQLDSEDFSEDLTHEVPVESTSTATFIAPALPPIRFSLGGNDFSDLLRSVGGPQDAARSLDQIIEGMEHEIARMEMSSPPPPQAQPQPQQTNGDSSHMTTPTNSKVTNGSRRNHSVDVTPVRRQPSVAPSIVGDADGDDLTIRHEPLGRSRTPSPSARPLTDYRKGSIDANSDMMAGVGAYARPTAVTELSMERTRSFSDTRDFRPTFERTRSRGDSDASIVPSGIAPIVQQRSRGDSNASIVPTGIMVTTPENATSKVIRPDTTDLVRVRLLEALMDSKGRGSTHVRFDHDFAEAIVMLLEQNKEDHDDMKRRLDGMKRASQQYVDGLSVAQTEYDRELKARRDAEAEVTRLRVLLSGQQVRLTALLGETKRLETQKQLSQEFSESLSSLEKEIAKLTCERDLTRAEVEELSTIKSSPVLANDADAAGKLSRSLSSRLDTIKSQYQHELLPLTSQKETLLREIAELHSSRDAFLEETTVLNARNEELARLNAQYAGRMTAGRPETGMDFDRRGVSMDQARPNISYSTTTSTVGLSEDGTDRYIKVSKPDVEPVPQPTRSMFGKWPGSRSRANKENNGAGHETNNKPKGREHTFQQISNLRLSRCHQCGEKMFGSQLRCAGCSIAVHARCVHQVSLACQHGARTPEENPPPVPAGPSMFGRELAEQIQSDSKEDARTIPVIVEKCISAVDALALDYEGIYRKTGGSGQSKMITQLFERGDYNSFDLLDTDRFNDICSVTSVLKSYFRSLPDPLLTYALHDRFIAASAIKDLDEKARLMQELVLELPPEHYCTARALMLHLHRVSEKSDENLMHARNLGVVFGPTLMRSVDPNAEFADMAGKALSVEWLVEHAPTLFEHEVPPESP